MDNLTLFPEVKCFSLRMHPDHRGWFIETYRSADMQEYLKSENFVQENVVFSRKHVLRGLHFQAQPYSQGKLIFILNGRIFDIVVDIRKNSTSFGKYAIHQLRQFDSMWIPPGFAHGFLTLTDRAMVSYKLTRYYNPEFEQVLAWNDPSINVQWKIPEASSPILSERDSQGRKWALIDYYDNN